MYGVSREGVDASNWFPPIKGIAGTEKIESDDAVAPPVDDKSHHSGLQILLLSCSNNGLGLPQSSQEPELLHSIVDADIENFFDTLLSEWFPDLCLTIIPGGEVLAEMLELRFGIKH